MVETGLSSLVSPMNRRRVMRPEGLKTSTSAVSDVWFRLLIRSSIIPSSTVTLSRWFLTSWYRPEIGMPQTGMLEA